MRSKVCAVIKSLLDCVAGSKIYHYPQKGDKNIKNIPLARFQWAARKVLQLNYVEKVLEIQWTICDILQVRKLLDAREAAQRTSYCSFCGYLMFLQVRPLEQLFHRQLPLSANSCLRLLLQKSLLVYRHRCSKIKNLLWFCHLLLQRLRSNPPNF